MEKACMVVYNPNIHLIHHEMKTRGKREIRDKDRILFYEYAKSILKMEIHLLIKIFL